ncbi:MAG: L-aspartate oxidase [Betaproteobacteria bacterium RIFCSPLOWO2_12_FULL_66_14]|nr:MAG: L-aspartate oxidase [Betaproteobacteria bacterium RIFCSPLOWO2_12_FULL_66_14]
MRHTLHCVQDRVVVVGGGIAGLATALELSPLPCTVLVSARLCEDASTPWAQGGIAAVHGTDDHCSLHAADTVIAGAGLSDPAVAARVTAAAPSCIEALIQRGIAFDRDAAGALALGLEAAHSRRRIIHANGDGTGRAVIEGLIGAARASACIEIMEHTRAVELVRQDGAVVGVRALRGDEALLLAARGVVLASGGLGGLYAHTTNPLGATGSGLALAARAGAVLRDMEFVQFHPTAIATGADPMPLASEAVRGEGAILVNARGERFMAGTPGAELAPRDVVARAIWHEIEAGERVYLDARQALGRRFPERFPSVAALCRGAGLDPASQPIPVRPAAHYHMGGVAVDGRGRTSVRGLWACGEVAATGLHGANRLASNSLLEALAYARWIAQDIDGTAPSRRLNLALPPTGARYVRAHSADMAGLRQLMSEAVGVIRSETGLKAAIARLQERAFGERISGQMLDCALVGLLVATAACRRQESRGAHFRRDFPLCSPDRTHSLQLTLADVRRQAGAPEAGFYAAGAA